jgi:Ca2+-binding EF-hand superfamily protein
MIRDMVDVIYNKYDTNGSASLDANEIYNLIKDCLANMKSNEKVNQTEIEEFITAVDKSGDRKVQKEEFIEAIKKLL